VESGKKWESRQLKSGCRPGVVPEPTA